MPRRKSGRPPGRPQLDARLVREPFTIRVTDVERAQLAAAAEQQGLSLRAWAVATLQASAAQAEGERRTDAWLKAFRRAMASGDAAAGEQNLVALVALQPALRHVALARLTAAERGWIADAAYRRDGLAGPRARSVTALVRGFQVTLDDGGMLVAPWEAVPALARAHARAREWIELQQDGRRLWWPATDDGIALEALVSRYPVSVRRSAPP